MSSRRTIALTALVSLAVAAPPGALADTASSAVIEAPARSPTRRTRSACMTSPPSTTGPAYLAWSDSRATQANGDAEDAYFSRIRHTGPLRSGTSDTRPGWLWGLLGAGITLAAGGSCC